MPRPADTYTHAQFDPIESDHKGETVRCRHCKIWTGSVKTLSRKKEHLLKCPAYARWRHAGNGEDLRPPNRYNKRDSSTFDDSSLYVDVNYTPNNQPRNKLHATDLSKAFHEFWDDAETQKCMRTRCKYCGAVRAKNTTRQYEHLQQCTDFLSSTEGQQAQVDGLIPHPGGEGRRDIFRGDAPNPSLTFPRPKSRSTPNRASIPSHGGPKSSKPSLVNHLLSKNRSAVEEATQLSFLSHAGCGTLSQGALRQWLSQQGCISRAMITLVGGMIGKIRLADTNNVEGDSSYRAFDLLLSTLNNSKRELEFLWSIQLKYGLSNDRDGNVPKAATKGMIDLFASAASPGASLLEALVVLWALQYLELVSWQYASNFYQPGAGPTATSYSLPSYLQSQPAYGGSSNAPPNSSPEHITALQEALIPNWTSAGFAKFVDACKAIVDELANAQTTGSGATELNNCESTFRQVCWLWKQTWPEVTATGESSESGNPTSTRSRGRNGVRGVGGSDGVVIDIPDEDEDGDADDAEGEREDDDVETESPFGRVGSEGVGGR